MDLSEEEDLFPLGFVLLDDKRKKKKQRNVDFGFVRYFASVKYKECFQIFLMSFNLVIQNIILFNNTFTSVFDKIFKLIRFFDIYIQYIMKV